MTEELPNNAAPPSWHGTRAASPLPDHLQVYANRISARQRAADAAWEAQLLDLEADDLK